MGPVGVIEGEAFGSIFASRRCFRVRNTCGFAAHFYDAFAFPPDFAVVEGPHPHRYFDRRHLRSPLLMLLQLWKASYCMSVTIHKSK